MQLCTFPWFARPRDHQRSRHFCEGAVQRCRFCEVAANHFCSIHCWSLLWMARHQAQRISFLRQECSSTSCDTSGSARNQKHIQPGDENHYDDTALHEDLANVESFFAQYALIQRENGCVATFRAAGWWRERIAK